MIKESAVMQDGVIFTGRRHKDCMANMRASGIKIKPRPYCVQGFVTDDGLFLTREQALVEARACGQLTKPLLGSILTSEDLW